MQSPGPTRPPRTSTLRAFGALRHVKYRWYWLSGMGLTAAQGFQQLGMAWLVLDLTGSVGQLGLVIFFQGLPMSLTSFYGGVLADRHDRRKLLIAAQAFTMINLMLLAVLTLAGVVAVWQVYLSSIGLGLMQSVTMPARSALVRSLVGDEDMLNAVALNAVQMHSSRIIWPSMAGALIALAGAGTTLAVSAFASFMGIVFILLIGSLPEEPRAERRSHIQEIREGLRYSFSEPAISTVMRVVICCGLFGLAYMNLAPAFAREELGLGASGAGLFMMSMGIGAIVGSAWLLVFPIKDGQRAFILLMFVFAINLILQAAIANVAAAFLLMGLFGLSNAVLVVAGQTFLQTTVPQHLLGRVIGLWSLAGGLAFVTALPIGLIGDAVGLRPAIAGAAALLTISTLWFGVILPRHRGTDGQPAASLSDPRAPG